MERHRVQGEGKGGREGRRTKKDMAMLLFDAEWMNLGSHL